MTAQREVDAGPRPSVPVTTQSLGADTLTSNQSVFLSPSTHLACFGSLPPPPAEEVYVQKLVNRCKAGVLLLWNAASVTLSVLVVWRVFMWSFQFGFPRKTKPERLH